jgi:hypothetical protein
LSFSGFVSRKGLLTVQNSHDAGMLPSLPTTDTRSTAVRINQISHPIHGAPEVGDRSIIHLPTRQPLDQPFRLPCHPHILLCSSTFDLSPDLRSNSSLIRDSGKVRFGRRPFPDARTHQRSEASTEKHTPFAGALEDYVIGISRPWALEA